MNETQIAKIQRFLMDEVMNSAVQQVLLKSFLKRRPNEDTAMKAARFIATELLEDAWKELERHTPDNEENGSKHRQIGI
jgi:hypothetical protein